MSPKGRGCGLPSYLSQGLRLSEMVTLHRERGFQVVLYPGDKEHSPPHVHVFHGDEEVKIALGDEETAPWIWQVLGGCANLMYGGRWRSSNTTRSGS